MFRLTDFVAAVLVLVPVCFGVPGTQMGRAEEPVTFPLSGDIRGGEVLFENRPARILIGEVHGTAEIPPLVAVLVRSLSSQAETVLCLEMAESEQPRLDAFLASDGDDAAVRALFSGPHWFAPDGRASTAFLEMLQLVRQLARSGRPVRVVAIDADPLQDAAARNKPFTKEEFAEISRRRDRRMAENVQQVVAQRPKANIAVLVGNVHASVQRGVAWDAEYEPMGWHLKQELPGLVSLNFQSSGGEAWVMGDHGAGPRDFPGTNRGGKPFVELNERTTDGYDGIFYVGRITAAPPAKQQSFTVHDALERLQQLVPPGLFNEAATAEE